MNFLWFFPHLLCLLCFLSYFCKISKKQKNDKKIPENPVVLKENKKKNEKKNRSGKPMIS